MSWIARTFSFWLLIAALITPWLASAEEANGFQDQYADVNGVRLHYVAAGHGELIIFLHGFPEFWYQWKDQLAEFGKDHLAVAPDMRGYNLSSRPKEVNAYKARVLVEDVRALADKLGYKKFILVGHDWGGLIAWTFAMYYPERLEKLIILNAPHPGVFEREMRENPAQQFASQYMLLFNSPDAEKALAAKDYEILVYHVLSEGQALGYESDADRRMYLALWQDGGSLTAGLNYYRASRLEPAPASGDEWSPARHYAPDLKSYDVKVPTLVLWGLQDRYLLAGNLSGLGRYVPDMKVKLFPDASHWLNRAKSAEVNRYMRQFISGAPLEP